MKAVPRRYWRNLDIPLILAVIGLILLGFIAIYSASANRLLSDNMDPFYYLKRQAIFTVVGFIAAGIVLSIDYRAWRRWTRIGYFVNLAFLGLVLILGTTGFGAQRWFRLAGVNIQPSEIAKIIIIIVLAHYLEKHKNFDDWKIFSPFILIGIPMVLIMLQPDLGTSMIFVGIIFSMLYIAGAPPKKLLIIAALCGLAMLSIIALSYFEVVDIIKPYQLNRLLVFRDPYSDPTGSGWNIIQSMIAIGSGGFFGKGYLSGTQSQLEFLPANHTDFIFSVVAEEFGFIGSIYVLFLYAFIIWRGLKIAAQAKDRFGMLLASGCVSFFTFHLIINVGMTVGLMPVTGLPLPFLTYGGSTLVTSLLAIGILLNVGLRRQKIMF